MWCEEGGFTPISIFPRGLRLLCLDLLLNLGLLVDVVEVVHDDRDRQRDAENSTNCTNLVADFCQCRCLVSYIDSLNYNIRSKIINISLTLKIVSINTTVIIITVISTILLIIPIPRRSACQTKWLGRCRHSRPTSSWLLPSRETGKHDHDDLTLSGPFAI